MTAFLIVTTERMALGAFDLFEAAEIVSRTFCAVLRVSSLTCTYIDHRVTSHLGQPIVFTTDMIQSTSSSRSTSYGLYSSIAREDPNNLNGDPTRASLVSSISHIAPARVPL